jgi:hypothetical protein
MGTLFEQLPRKDRKVSHSDLDAFLREAVSLSKIHNITVTEVIAAKKALELERRNDLYLANGNIFDEQIAGIGELLQQLSYAVEGLKHSD